MTLSPGTRLGPYEIVAPRQAGLDLGQPRALFKLPALGQNWFYDVTAEGERFVAVLERTPLKVRVNAR
jgi:hypothetical protein